jgi:acetyl esterase/lipase
LTGAQDFYYRAPYGKLLHEKLVEAGVPSVVHSFKLADHGFLLFFPRTSQVAKTGMYTLAQWLNKLEAPPN